MAGRSTTGGAATSGLNASFAPGLTCEIHLGRRARLHGRRGIKDREAANARIEVRMREPRPVATDREKRRAALEQPVATWKADLRSEPQIARKVVKHLMGPIR